MDDKLHLTCPACGQINRLPAGRIGAAPTCGRCRTSLLSDAPIALDDSGFEHFVTHNALPIVIDFWAPWCGPCKMMAPVFEAAAARFKTRARLVKVDTERAPATAARFGIRSIPTLIVLRDGREVARVSGAQDLSRLSAFIEAQL